MTYVKDATKMIARNKRKAPCVNTELKLKNEEFTILEIVDDLFKEILN